MTPIIARNDKTVIFRLSCFERSDMPGTAGAFRSGLPPPLYPWGISANVWMLFAMARIISYLRATRRNFRAKISSASSTPKEPPRLPPLNSVLAVADARLRRCFATCPPNRWRDSSAHFAKTTRTATHRSQSAVCVSADFSAEYGGMGDRGEF